MSASAMATAPLLDGEILDDPAWRGMPAASGFVQNTPDAGQPASQRTEVRIGYTEETLYIGIVAFDDDPSAIVVTDARRDASLGESDSLQILLDTYLDLQNGLVFGTNPSGLQYDGQVTREGSGGSRLGGSGGGFNRNWDGVWQVETRIAEYGWSAEFALPFKTLRYGRETVQNWGINIQRNIRRRNERSYWAPLDQQYNLYRVSEAGVLTGIAVPGHRNLQFIPYSTASFSRLGSQTSSDIEAGFDIKYSLTQSLTLDLTNNTDFAQVEVDEVQVNLDRFNLFFPEKRPFFLENAGQFAVGNTGDVELFFSRRIGISDDGEVIPINGGARVSGKLNRTNVGFLYMQTEDFDDTPANDFVIARVNQEFDNRSSLGAMFVNREATGALAANSDENRTLGIDGRWGIGEYITLSGFAAQTVTPGLEGRDSAYSARAQYNDEDWSLSAAWTEVEENFNPEVGFLRRDAYKSPSVSIFRRIRPGNNRRGIHEFRPHASWSAHYDFDNFKETAFLHVDNHIEWESGAELHTAVNFRHDGLLEPFEISDGIYVPTGSYSNHEYQIVAYTDQSAPLSISLRTVIGGFFNGDRVFISPTLRWRHGDRFTSQWSWSRNDVKLRTGDFTTDLGRIRLSYSLTGKSTLQALFQYNNVDDIWSANLRYSWLRTANTGLFIVYNDTRGFDSFSGEEPNRSVLIKYSHLFDIF
jgi:hypothetical protein